MNEKFFDLKKEKQDRIINAALKIFAENGYKHASTDDIVKEAGISKGLLFHYFSSKIGVYTFVYDYSVRFLKLELSSFVKAEEKNVFEISKMVNVSMLSVLKGYPYMKMFLEKAELETVVEALEAIEEKRSEFNDFINRIYEKADCSAFPANIDKEIVLTMLNYTISGLINESLADNSFNIDNLNSTVCGYISVMKNLIEK